MKKKKKKERCKGAKAITRFHKKANALLVCNNYLERKKYPNLLLWSLSLYSKKYPFSQFRSTAPANSMWGRGSIRENFDVVQTLFSKSQNINTILVTHQKHSTIQAVMKEVISILARPSADFSDGPFFAPECCS